MEYKAISKSVRVSPRKIRLVADTVRKLSVKDAITKLSLIRNIASKPLQKTLLSAVANAEYLAKQKKTDEKFEVNMLKIKSLDVLEGTPLKRFHYSTRGRTHPYKKRSSHIKIILEEANGTKS